MKKNRLLLLILVAIFGLFQSCTNKKPIVGFMLPNMNNQRYFLERDEFVRKINELGGEVLFTNSNNDEQLQVQQVDSLFNAGIQILVLDPVNRFSAAQIVRKAHDRNIKVISYDRLIANSNVDAYVAFDAKMTGQQMVSPVLKLKPEGKYILLGGDKLDINAIGIAEGQDAVLAPYIKSGKIQVVYKMFIEKWDAQEARIEVVRYMDLTASAPDVIIAANDAMANGAIEALKEQNLDGQILVTGNGGDLIACKNIMSGKQLMSVYKPVKKLAGLAAELSLKMLKDENTKDVLTKTLNNGYGDIPSCLLETIPMDDSNIKSTVVADGMVKEEDLLK